MRDRLLMIGVLGRAVARLTRSETVTVCPYEGVATWWSLVDGPDDVAWGYDEPLPEGPGLVDHLAFSGDDVTVEVVAG